jgi:hypothetical protein
LVVTKPPLASARFGMRQHHAITAGPGLGSSAVRVNLHLRHCPDFDCHHLTIFNAPLEQGNQSRVGQTNIRADSTQRCAKAAQLHWLNSTSPRGRLAFAPACRLLAITWMQAAGFGRGQ